MAAPFCSSIVYSYVTYASLFEFFSSGSYVGLTSVVVTDLVGMDKLSKWSRYTLFISRRR